MNRTTFSLEIFGDRFPVADTFERESNTRKLSAMKQALVKAIDSELTDRQKQMVTEYYFDGSSVTEIAKNHKLSKSTVSRQPSRSRERLKGALKSGMYSLWSDEI